MTSNERRKRIVELQQELGRLLREEHLFMDRSLQPIMDACRAMKTEGRNVEAIKFYRQHAGVSLREAKYVVDALTSKD